MGLGDKIPDNVRFSKTGRNYHRRILQFGVAMAIPLCFLKSTYWGSNLLFNNKPIDSVCYGCILEFRVGALTNTNLIQICCVHSIKTFPPPSYGQLIVWKWNEMLKIDIAKLRRCTRRQGEAKFPANGIFQLLLFLTLFRQRGIKILGFLDAMFNPLE